MVHIGIFPWTPIPTQPGAPAGSGRPETPVSGGQEGETRARPLGQILIRITLAQVGPFDGDTKETPIRPLKKNPLRFLQSPPVQENERLATQRMKRMGDGYGGTGLMGRSSSGCWTRSRTRPTICTVLQVCWSQRRTSPEIPVWTFLAVVADGLTNPAAPLSPSQNRPIGFVFAEIARVFSFFFVGRFLGRFRPIYNKIGPHRRPIRPHSARHFAGIFSCCGPAEMFFCKSVAYRPAS